MLYRKIIRPIFFKMSAERAHHVMMDSMHSGGKVPGVQSMLHAMYGVPESHELATDLWGLHFHNPIGLAAGLDKDAKAVPVFSSIGFGFIEVGTVTPKAQPGNELPRLFRLPSDQALINRMGFNNKGALIMAENLQKVHNRRVPIAVNIGKNKLTPNENAAEDYMECIRQLYPHADLFVVNISSPNTPDLRKLQHGEELKSLLSAVKAEMGRQQAIHNPNRVKPVLVKIAPDLSDAELETVVAAIAESGVSGIIASNTTLSREGLTHHHAGETGGLSGVPLKIRSTEIIRKIYKQTQGKLPIIGSGGVFSSEDAYEKIRAGASLVEIYTALIYQGPIMNRQLNEGLKKLLKRDGYTHISQAVGSGV
jgi:dihydroorotate dehydrogenase